VVRTCGKEKLLRCFQSKSAKTRGLGASNKGPRREESERKVNSAVFAASEPNHLIAGLAANLLGLIEVGFLALHIG